MRVFLTAVAVGLTMVSSAHAEDIAPRIYGAVGDPQEVSLNVGVAASVWSAGGGNWVTRGTHMLFTTEYGVAASKLKLGLESTVSSIALSGGARAQLGVMNVYGKDGKDYNNEDFYGLEMGADAFIGIRGGIWKSMESDEELVTLSFLVRFM